MTSAAKPDRVEVRMSPDDSELMFTAHHGCARHISWKPYWRGLWHALALIWHGVPVELIEEERR